MGNIGILPQHRADCASWKSPKRRGKGMENSFRTPCWCTEMVWVVRAPPQPGGHIALLLLPPTQHWGETHTVTHTRTILLRVDTVYFLICLILWCKCSVLLSCGVQGRGWESGTFGLSCGRETEEVRPLSLIYLLFFEGRRSLCYLSLVSARAWNVVFFFSGNAIFVETDHEHIPDSSLSVLLFSPDSCLLRRYNMCLVLADSHVYKVHICVHMCNTRYSSNLLLWLLLMMILVPFLKFQPVFCWFCLFFVPLLVLICCWWIVLQEPKKGRWLLWFFTLSFISGVCGHFNEALFLLLLL